MAHRLICGLTIKTDHNKAEEVLKAICRIDNDNPENRHIRASAERLDAWLDSLNFYADYGDLDALFCAGKRCSRALWIETVLPNSKPTMMPHHVAPVDLRAAASLYRHVEQGDYEGRKMNPATDNNFEKIKLAWVDYIVKRFVFLRYGPRAKICARALCDSRGTDERPLFRCKGKCPEQWKPLYCSEECQEKVNHTILVHQ